MQLKLIFSGHPGGDFHIKNERGDLLMYRGKLPNTFHSWEDAEQYRQEWVALREKNRCRPFNYQVVVCEGPRCSFNLLNPDKWSDV